MNHRAPWYNEKRVSQSGSVILTAWRDQQIRQRTGVAISADNDITSNKTLQELANMYAWGDSYAGAAVNQQSAMAVSAVYACVGLVSGAISTLPLPIYARDDDARKRVDHPYWWLLNERSHPNFSSAVFFEYLMMSLLLHGDAFAEIIRANPRSNIAVGFRPFHPDRVKVEEDARGVLYYTVTDTNGRQRDILGVDMIHVAGLGFDGKRGMSVVMHAAKQGIGTALAAEEYSARFFGNGARPDFALKTEGKLTDDAVKTLRATWSARHSGVKNSHLPAILTGGLGVEKLTMTSEDAQVIQTRGFQVEDICRFFGVPPFMIGHTDKTTSWGSGVENMGRGFVKFTLSRHLTKIEQEFNHKLWPNREKYFVEFNVAGLERGDLKSENEALRIGLGRAGEPAWLTVNEVRKIKNLPPVAGGDELQKASPVKAAAAADQTDAAADNKTGEDPKPA
jgi:HK97 family phage portal protein